MTTGSDPWADPATPTEPGAPYAGPPATAPPSPNWAPPGYGQPGYGQPGHGAPGHPAYGYPAYSYLPSGHLPPGYGYPAPWPPPPPRPRRPGQVIASAVLAFVQAAMVIIASLYVWFFASIVTIASAGAPGVLDAEGLATEGTVLAAVQVVSAVLLVTAGVLALNRRTSGTWRLLVGGHALQIALAVYWWVRLAVLAGDFPGAEAEGLLIGSSLFFAAGPAVGLGLVLTRASRSWFAAERAPGPAAA